MRVLVLTPEPVNTDLLRSTLDREDKGIAEVEQRYGIPVTHAEIGH